MACNHPVGVQLPGHPPGFVAEAVVVKAPVRKAGQASSILARCTKCGHRSVADREAVNLSTGVRFAVATPGWGFG
jgi:hypothetical protein